MPVPSNNPRGGNMTAHDRETVIYLRSVGFLTNANTAAPLTLWIRKVPS